MKLIETYVIGVLEHIGQERGRVAVRILCNRKVKVYDNQKESETPFTAKFADEFTQEELTLSHPVGYFTKGDKVKLSRFPNENETEEENNDCFVLKNLTLSKSDVCGLKALKPEKPMKDLFSIEALGTLENLSLEKRKVTLRIKCTKKIFTFFENGDCNKMREKEEAFEKTIVGIIPRDNLRLDLCIETLVLYKTGDKVRLSCTVEEENVYDFDNLTLSINYDTPKYKTRWAL
jgi:hypothetical protein